MKNLRQLAGLPGWIAHRMLANYWLLSVCAVIVAFPVAYGIIWLDREWATAALIARDLVPVADPETARDFLGVAAGINAAFITLYFSITLIVLSMAAGNLGVRLIDRWLERRLVRVSIAGLSFSLIVSLIAMLSTRPDGPMSDVPLLLVLTVLLLQAINVAMLTVSLHRLGRTMFVDTSIHRISEDACARSKDLTGQTPLAGDLPHTLAASRGGYIEDVDQAGLAKMFDHDCCVRVEVAPGQHVLPGDPLLRSSFDFDEKRAKALIAIGSYRSDAQGTVFQIRLLVEIAARALSPAINDFYTAITCADKLAAVIRSQAGTWIADDMEPAPCDTPGIRLIGQDFRSLFKDPMNAFRQAACQYPAVTIRMIDNYGRLAVRFEEDERPAELSDFLRSLAMHLRDHAMSVAEYDHDRDDIAEAYEHHFGQNAAI